MSQDKLPDKLADDLPDNWTDTSPGMQPDMPQATPCTVSAVPGAMPGSLAGLTVRLASLHGFWNHWGFEPWSAPPFAGVCRVQRFVKSGFLGSIAEYKAWEAIVWECGNAEERKSLWKQRAPMPEVLTQRYLFLLPEPWAERRIRSFFFGLRGYLEFYAYNPILLEDGCPACLGHPKVQDLTGLVDLAVSLEGEAQTMHSAGGEGLPSGVEGTFSAEGVWSNATRPDPETPPDKASR